MNASSLGVGRVAGVDVLVVGSGAREHALCRSLHLDEDVEKLYCAPGNAGTASMAGNVPVDASDPDAITSLAVSLAVDLVVIGPEVPLVAGAADTVRAAGVACFGPSAEAAHLEGSKAFAKRSWLLLMCQPPWRTCARRRTRSPRRSTPSARLTSSRMTAWPLARASS